MKEEEFRTNINEETLVVRYRKVTNEDILKGNFKGSTFILKTADSWESDIVSFDKISSVMVNCPTISFTQCINHTEEEKRGYTLATLEFKHPNQLTPRVVNVVVPSSNSDINDGLEEEGYYLITNVYII